MDRTPARKRKPELGHGQVENLPYATSPWRAKGIARLQTDAGYRLRDWFCICSSCCGVSPGGFWAAGAAVGDATAAGVWGGKSVSSDGRAADGAATGCTGAAGAGDGAGVMIGVCVAGIGVTPCRTAVLGE